VYHCVRWIVSCRGVGLIATRAALTTTATPTATVGPFAVGSLVILAVLVVGVGFGLRFFGCRF
jgi:hypothetical protein